MGNLRERSIWKINSLIPPRLAEARLSLANNEKLRNTFGWEPKVKLEE